MLAKFVDIIDSDASWAIKVKALELIGKFLNMFIDQKKVNIDIKQLVAGIGENELRALAGENYGSGEEVKHVGSSRRERYLGMHDITADRMELSSPDGGGGAGVGD